MKETDEIVALVNLLDDPDEFVFSEVKNKLISLGSTTIPYLEEFWEDNSLDVNYQNRIEDLIQEIQFNIVYTELTDWAESDDPNLFEGVFIINKYQYPDLDKQPLIDSIEQIKQDVWLEISNDLTSFEKINTINKILFEEYGFSGNKKNYHSPQNSFLNNVLETKRGNPLLLSVVYILVTQDLGLPVYGVNLPNHFVVCYLDQDSISYYLEGNEDEKVLIYMNPFSKGSMFNHEEINRFLFQLNKPAREEYFSPCSNIDIIKRILNNLIYSYQKSAYANKIDDLKVLLEIFG